MKIKITKEEKVIEGTVYGGASVKPFGTSAHIPFKKEHTGKEVSVIVPTEPKYVWLLKDSEKKRIINETRKIIIEEVGELEHHRLNLLEDLKQNTFDLDSLLKIISLLETKGKEKELTKKIRKLYSL